MSHHSAFIHNGKMYCYGGLIGSQGSSTNGDFYILDLKTLAWSKKDLSSSFKEVREEPDPKNKGRTIQVEYDVKTSCEERDDHSACFD